MNSGICIQFMLKMFPSSQIAMNYRLQCIDQALVNFRTEKETNLKSLRAMEAEARELRNCKPSDIQSTSTKTLDQMKSDVVSRIKFGRKKIEYIDRMIKTYEISRQRMECSLMDKDAEQHMRFLQTHLAGATSDVDIDGIQSDMTDIAVRNQEMQAFSQTIEDSMQSIWTMDMDEEGDSIDALLGYDIKKPESSSVPPNNTSISNDESHKLTSTNCQKSIDDVQVQNPATQSASSSSSSREQDYTKKNVINLGNFNF